MKKLIDFRSDTLTKPSPAMRQAMHAAPVGDDVFREDPTVNALEENAAKMAGKESALYCSSGTQSNLMALMSHCERGDEYIAGQSAHIYLWEAGGGAVLGSINPQPLDFEADGTLDLDKVAMAIKPLDDHHARTKLLCLENTTNGKVLPLAYLKQARDFALKQGLAMHLDGARAFHAAVHLGVDIKEITQHFDTVSLCLSKGLGAPVGSVLCGPEALIQKARRWRKMLGGGMRQAGIIAAGGLYALQNNVARLKDDHDHARLLFEGLSQISGVSMVPGSCHTNMLFMNAGPDYAALQNHLLDQGIRWPKTPNKWEQIRLVTHLDISRGDIDKTLEVVREFYRRLYVSDSPAYLQAGPSDQNHLP